MVRKFIAFLVALMITTVGMTQPVYADSGNLDAETNTFSVVDGRGNNLFYFDNSLNKLSGGSSESNSAAHSDEFIAGIISGIVTTAGVAVGVTAACYIADGVATAFFPPAAILAAGCPGAGAMAGGAKVLVK
jgi:hypothetical protein